MICGQVVAKIDPPSEGISSATDLIERVLKVCSTTLDRHRHVKSLQFHQIIEETVGNAVSQFHRFIIRNYVVPNNLMILL